MSWVANELVCDGERFYMECIREPPEWFLWYQSNVQLTICTHSLSGFGAARKHSMNIKQGFGYSVFATRTLLEYKRGQDRRKSKQIKGRLKMEGKSSERVLIKKSLILFRSWSGAVIPLSVSRLSCIYFHRNWPISISFPLWNDFI